MDVHTKPEAYAKRAIELGHNRIFTTCHAIQGNIFEYLRLSEQYNLKMSYGVESYYVKDRFKKDRSNKHIILIAKNNDGAMQLNEIMSEAQETGFYYRPRIDLELLQKINPKDIIITTACAGGIWDDYELILALHKRFKDNFLLELQSHNFELQKNINNYLLKVSEENGIKIIHANDSHYIYPDDSKYRDILLKAKEIPKHDNEKYMILDYPDSDMIFERYEKQGILTRNQVKEALENTLIFDECEDITYINKDIKIPEISKTPDKDLKEIINLEYSKIKDSIPIDKRSLYLSEIRKEVDIIEKTKTSNYFLIDYKIVKDAVEKYGGVLTKTGRGSAVSFYITKLLGLTGIDRIVAPVTLYPSRFMSAERILKTKSLPDIDINTTDREPFIKATKDLLGEENCAWMLAWKPLQDSSAFRLYCKGIGLDIKEYNDVAMNLDEYRESPKWKNIIEESKKFVGVIESISESPCSMCLYDKPLRKELGIVRTSKDKFCCLLDGYNCDKYKYLKNDYLNVLCWSIIKKVCDLANIKVPEIDELENLLDKETYQIYEKGLTCTVNQVDSDFATGLVKRYKPKTSAEMSAFVAIIRPGCAKLLQDFIERKPYSTGVKELDEILKDSSHRMIYQESIMKYLIWLNVLESETYDIISKIKKKVFKENELEDLKNTLKKSWIEKLGGEKGFLDIWGIVQDAANYSFNCSHSLAYGYDSLYGAFLKSHYPMEYYKVALDSYIDDQTRTSKLIKELFYFGIKLRPIKFRYSRSNYMIDKQNKIIYKGISSIKYMNDNVSEELYSLRDNTYNNFVDLLYDIKSKTSANKRQIEALIKLDFFLEFGESNFLLKTFEYFNKFYDNVNIGKSKIEEFGIPIEQIKINIEKETNTLYRVSNMRQFLINTSKFLEVKEMTLEEKIEAQHEYLGYIDIIDEKYNGVGVITEIISTKYSPRIKVYSLKNGTTTVCKMKKELFNRKKIKINSVLFNLKYQVKLKTTFDSKTKKFIPVYPAVNEIWILDYTL